jgi:hypothetical protein
MSPTKKKAPAPKKTSAKQATAKAAPAKTAKAAAKKPAAKSAAKRAGKPAAKSASKSASKPAAKPATAKKGTAAVSARAKDAAAKAEKPSEKAIEKSAGKARTKGVATAAADAKTAAAAKSAPPPAKAPAKAAGKPSGKSSGGKASATKADEDGGTPTKRAKPRKPVTPTGPRHPKLGFRWSCYNCDAKFYDLGKDEPLCPKCGADQRDRPADEPRHSSDHARPRVVRPMAQLLDDDEPVAPHVEDDLGLDGVAEADDMFEADGDITHLELDAADLEGDAIEAAETDEF